MSLKMWSLKKSVWVFHVNVGACNNCDIEIVNMLTPKYDIERFGIKLVGSPRHADVGYGDRGVTVGTQTPCWLPVWEPNRRSFACGKFIVRPPSPVPCFVSELVPAGPVYSKAATMWPALWTT